ncbi:MAG: ABC transporter substrate-binding protein [Burkholderiales bacterium]|jgi:branched-chain amino acid transport system substrate-binding protein|nr:ABC transporter substrate-binding protein [Burkholderiales bacterium]
MDHEKALTVDDGVRLPSRREVLAGTGAVGLMLMNAGSVFAQGADGANTIRVGFVSPRTGPLASFGETDGYVLDLARKSLAAGLTVGGKKYAVEILDRDTQSDPARASQLAKALIDSSKVDLILTTSAPETTNPVADACEAAGVPCLATVVPWESFYFGRGAKPGQPSPFKWSYVFSFGVAQFAKSFVSGWAELPTNKRVAALYPNDADGNAIREHLAPELEKAGFTVVDAGPYEDGTTDYSAQISKFKAAKCDIFNTFPIPPDFAAFWRQAAQQGLTKTIKIAQIAKTGLFPSSITALGPLGYNLASGCYWHKNFPYKSPLTGVTSLALADGYEKAANKQWTQQLGASMSLLDAGFEALKASSDPKNKASVAKALSTLKTTTMVGKVDFTSGPVANVSTTPIINAQWIKAAPGSKYKLDYVIVENACDPNVPVAAKLRLYNS